MENKTNSAIRLNKIIQKAYTNDNKIIADVWKNIFDINESNKHNQEISIIECLNNLNDEFELFKLRNKEFMYEECAEQMNMCTRNVYRIAKRMKSKIMKVIY